MRNLTGEILPVEDDEIQIIGTGPVIFKNHSPIGRDIVFPQAGQ